MSNQRDVDAVEVNAQTLDEVNRAVRELNSRVAQLNSRVDDMSGDLRFALWQLSQILALLRAVPPEQAPTPPPLDDIPDNDPERTM